MKTTKLFITAAAMILSQMPSQSFANEPVQLGAHIDQFKIECSGTLVVRNVSQVKVGLGFTDRAGNYRPPKGYAYLKLGIQKTTAGCDKLKDIGVDLTSQNFEYLYSTPSTDLDQIQAEAQKHIGQTTAFETTQYFRLATADGKLPFFPLLHSELVVLKTTDGYYMQKNYEAQNPAAQEYLSNEDKVQLTTAIFEFIKTNSLEGPMSDNLIIGLLENAPSFQKDFRNYLDQVLKIYATLENKQLLPTETGFHFDFNLTHMAAGLAKLTHQFPEYYEFNIPNLLAHHPSMLMNSQIPNVTTQDLENAIDLIEKNLTEGVYSSTVKFYLQEALEYIAGSYGTISSKYISNLSSKYSKEKAKALLLKHYAN